MNKKKVKMRQLVKLLIIPILFISGCRIITVTTPEKRVTYTNIGFNTSLGVLDVETSAGTKIHLENLDSNSQALEVAGKALDMARSTANPLP